MLPSEIKNGSGYEEPCSCQIFAYLGSAIESTASSDPKSSFSWDIGQVSPVLHKFTEKARSQVKGLAEMLSA